MNIAVVELLRSPKNHNEDRQTHGGASKDPAFTVILDAEKQKSEVVGKTGRLLSRIRKLHDSGLSIDSAFSGSLEERVALYRMMRNAQAVQLEVK